jgi:signal transduction histidine kinase
MTAINIAGLVNLLGYTLGIALYAILLVMVLRHPTQQVRLSGSRDGSTFSVNGLLLAAALLGLIWNIGALTMYVLKGFGLKDVGPMISAVSFSALGFLPAVVVHSVLRQPSTLWRQRPIVISAYSLSAVAAAFQFYDAIRLGVGPSPWALRLLTFGYLGLLAVLILTTRRHEGWKKVIWASALAVFAVSALHLAHHQNVSADTWYVELTGHHASLPLAFAILYEDYRFGFADIFLKRALTLTGLIAVAFGLYVGVAWPLLKAPHAGAIADPRSLIIILTLWVATALLYPSLRRGAIWFVDEIILRREDYGKLKIDLARLLNEHEVLDEILTDVCGLLAPALSAHNVQWTKLGPDSVDDTAGLAEDSLSDNSLGTVSEAETDNYVSLLEPSGSKGASILVPTAEPPYYKIEISNLAGGRRLLSDDLAMLETAALMIARRVDALRVTHERCEQNLREQEINKLATEAQLRALRAQVNPHFLFNALTTIGYLVQTDAARAFETLMKLTSLLRGVLRTEGEFVTLGEELKLIAAYVDIERARFEERLRVFIEIPEELLSTRLPSLLVQPLVENAIKHGITPSRLGGEVRIRAELQKSALDEDGSGDVLRITVSDTGIGASEIELARGRRRGVGLNNIEERLRFYGGQAASLNISSTLGAGTFVELRIPDKLSEHGDVSGKRFQDFKERMPA